MSTVSSRPSLPNRASLPTPFERGRLLQALRAHRRLVLIVMLLGLFGGALVSRLSVPLDYRASGEARLNEDASLMAARVLDDRVLESARALAQSDLSVAELRARLQVFAKSPSVLQVVAHASDSETAERLADSVVSAFVAHEAARARASRAQRRGSVDGELEQARKELEQASLARATALAREGVADPEAELARLRTQSNDLEAQIADAHARASAAAARGAVFSAQGAGVSAQRAGAELPEAQRKLSLLIAELGENDPEVTAQRQRIKRLQTSAVAPVSHSLGNRAESRAQKARAQNLELEHAALATRVNAVEQLAARIAPLTEARDRAKTRVAELEQRRSALTATGTVAEVAARAHVTGVERRWLRVLVAALTPLISLLMVLLVVGLSEVKDFRVSAATELAHWLSAPVVAVSAWPEREAALESLVDGLFDAAVDAVGTTLILPLTEAERPLAHTIAAQLNARAQRHFRSATGARITVAQAWEGELNGSRIKRGAEVADRVLWVAAADHHHGKDMAERAATLGRTTGVAAVLVEARVEGLARTVGDVRSFWAARSASDAAARSVPPARVPVH